MDCNKSETVWDTVIVAYHKLFTLHQVTDSSEHSDCEAVLGVICYILLWPYLQYDILLSPKWCNILLRPYSLWYNIVLRSYSHIHMWCHILFRPFWMCDWSYIVQVIDCDISHIIQLHDSINVSNSLQDLIWTYMSMIKKFS